MDERKIQLPRVNITTVRPRLGRRVVLGAAITLTAGDRR